ncbi:MAG: hypothetical protein JXB26_12005 [Candidatus Aminicenantes bacterium]|nr:hypothetical protein [Candidatus Aminicenantes bacterium]
MKNPKNRLSLLTFVLAVLSVSSLFFIMAAVHIYKFQLFLEEDSLALPGVIVLLCFALVFLFLIVSFLWQMGRIRRENHTSARKNALLVFGVFCLLLFIGEKTMIDEIGRELKLGWETLGEMLILNVMLVLQLFYSFVILFSLAKASEDKANLEKGGPIQEENIFTIAQIIGIACGAIGLLFNFNFFLGQHRMKNPVIIVPFFILILLPYGLTVLYWIWMRLGKAFSQWYDEKQWRDVALAGLITLLFSVPGMACLFLFQKPIGFFWFPHYIFLILTVFSTSTLFLFRNTE